MRAFIVAFGVLVAAAVAEDYSGPGLTVTNPRDGQTVTTSRIKLQGTVTDDGYGENGVAGIKVDGNGASGDTASGSGTASWWKTVTLVPGENRLTLVATDKNVPANSSTYYLTVYYDAPEEEDDAVPDGVVFTAASNVLRGATVTSNTITVKGINVAVEASVVGGEMSVDGGGWVTDATVRNGQTIQLQAVAKDELAGAKTVMLSIGGRSFSWLVQTLSYEPLPDYAIQKIVLSPAQPSEGVMFSASVTIKNLGAAPGTDGTLFVYPAESAIPLDAAIPGIAPKKTIVMTLKGMVCQGGRYTLKAEMIPPTGDSNPKNNLKTMAYSVAAPPNLKVMSVRFAPETPKAGKKFTAYVTVMNTGGIGSASTAAAWLDYEDGDAPAKTASVGALKTNKKMTLAFTGLKAGPAGAAQTFTVALDYTGAMAETDETDNLATATLTPK